jgi:Holliday junction DNA helicase RuvA
MIASIRGILRQKRSDACVIEAGGLGYEVTLTQGALAQLPAPGETVEFYTHFHVREDAQQLFGFASEEEKQLFLLLLTVKGVGPKLGMTMLSQLGGRDLLQALSKRDLARLGLASGVGKKLAERLAVELSDKAQKITAGATAVPMGAADAVFEEGDAPSQAVQALVALGFSVQQARLAVSKAGARASGAGLSVEALVKLALKSV